MSHFDNMQADGLDGEPRAVKGARTMTRTPLLITLVAAAALAGCNKQSHTIVAPGPDNGDNVAVANADVQLPPAIAASKTYRCGDNKLIYVDWLSDNKSANVRTEPNGAPTQVAMTEPGKPLTGGGYSLTGSAAGSSVTLERPGSDKQSCKA